MGMLSKKVILNQYDIRLINEEANKMGILDGKVCIVTGGAGSLGLESARLMLQEGAKVMLVDKHEEPLLQAVDKLGSLAGNLSFAV